METRRMTTRSNAFQEGSKATKETMKENVHPNHSETGRSNKAYHSRYELLEKLGEGTYGRVYKARDRQDGHLVALKRIKHPEEDTEGISATSLREIVILKELDHPYIVK